MTFPLRFVLFHVCLSLLYSCSEQVHSKQEQFYIDTADSLRLYKDLPYLSKELRANEKAQDFLELNFHDFRKKYNITNTEMKALIEAIHGHISVAKTIDFVNTHTK